LTKKDVKLTGKEHAKLNTRKKFYEKFGRICQRIQNKSISDQIILLSMNKLFTFPEYDELSITFIDDHKVVQDEIKQEESLSIALPFIDEAYFLVKSSRAKLLNILRKETLVDDAGNERKGTSSTNDSYNYQSAFNWGVEFKDLSKLIPLIEKEIETPTTYNIKVQMKKLEKMTYRKAWKPPRRRRR
jgi:hypothetical protein